MEIEVESWCNLVLRDYLKNPYFAHFQIYLFTPDSSEAVYLSLCLKPPTETCCTIRFCSRKCTYLIKQSPYVFFWCVCVSVFCCLYHTRFSVQCLVIDDFPSAFSAALINVLWVEGIDANMQVRHKDLFHCTLDCIFQNMPDYTIRYF